LGKIGVPLTVKDGVIILAYILVCGVITTVILYKIYHHTMLHLNLALCIQLSLWPTPR